MLENFPKSNFEFKNSKLYHGDTVEILNSFEQNVFDVIFADPPYNLSNGGTTCQGGKRVSVNKGEWDKSKGIENDLEFHVSWINACKRVLKDNGTLWISGTYHNIYTCGYVLLKDNWHIINDIVWYKSNAAPNLACRMFTASHETLLWAKKNKKFRHYFDYNEMKYGDWKEDKLKNPGKQMRSVWAIGFPKSEEKIYGKHPAQKPYDLLIRIIKASCPKNGIVLDPFCGSGTTGAAALSFGAYFIGIDSELSYITDIAWPRLKNLEECNRYGERKSNRNTPQLYRQELA